MMSKKERPRKVLEHLTQPDRNDDLRRIIEWLMPSLSRAVLRLKQFLLSLLPFQHPKFVKLNPPCRHLIAQPIIYTSLLKPPVKLTHRLGNGPYVVFFMGKTKMGKHRAPLLSPRFGRSMSENFRVCSVSGCCRISKAKGLCNTHYAFFLRNGHREFHRIRTSPGSALKFLKDLVAKQDNVSSECIPWPFARTKFGYGKIMFEGNFRNAHSVICEMVLGPPPNKAVVAAHFCGNGHLGCVHPRHVRWATISENMMDRVGHGTAPRGERHANAKLNIEAVLYIRNAYPGENYADLARKFSVSRGTIQDVVERKTWSWVLPDASNTKAERT